MNLVEPVGSTVQGGELPSNLIVMKYARSEGESGDAVLLDKASDLLSVGLFMWGYNGTVCNPATQVNPFLKRASERGEGVYLALVRTHTLYRPGGAPARACSPDGVDWEGLPDGVRVSGSRYGLLCDDLMLSREVVDLAGYEVAVGPSAGRGLAGYIRGRNTKACAVRSEDGPGGSDPVEIRALAHVVWAYFLA